ncbi:NAD-glutamate dehydrogenase [Alteromonadaceae bacterium BrNp21-10]|nr:NAD-glutamate dehydrogenase [Alteromonadaceae bacterium BrNp21-10]
MTVISSHSVILENVYNAISKKVNKSQAKLVEQFARVLFKNISKDDLENRNDSDLYGAVLSLWNNFSEYDGKKPKIRVYNPEVSKHGWNSSHTVIEIIVNDMPFLVDSIRMVLNRLGITTHLLLNSPITLVRDSEHQLTQFLESSSKLKSQARETVFIIEIDHQSQTDSIQQLTDELFAVVDEISLAVSDWQLMRDRLQQIIDEYDQFTGPADTELNQEAKAFLQWVLDHNFTLMGYRHYDAKAIKGDYQWVPDKDSSLGFMKKSMSDRIRLTSKIPPSAREETLGSSPLILTKTNSKSRVHRNAYLDYIGIKRFDKDGKVIAEDRFIGLYSAAFYNSSATQLPVLQNKIARLCKNSGFTIGSHAYKAFVNTLEIYPRDELLQSNEQELTEIIRGIFQMQERGISRLFVRKDTFGRFYSCMAFVPRERYNTALRVATQDLLKRCFNSEEEVEFTTFFSESVYARTQYIVRVKNNNVDINVKDIEKNLIELGKGWDDRLSIALRSVYGEAKGKALENEFTGAFSRGYKDHNLPSTAAMDIDKIGGLNSDSSLDMLFYKPVEEANDSDVVKLKLFHLNQPIHLSDVLPMLENFGLRVIDESPYQVKGASGSVCWIMDFSMLHKRNSEISLEKAQSLFQEAFSNVWYKHLEDDAFNRLVLGAGLPGRTVTILRAYAKYMRQTGSLFSRDYIASTLDRYPLIASMLTKLFEQRLNPAIKRSEKQTNVTIDNIKAELDRVSNLDDDRIIRRYLDMILATLRTNFYQPDKQGQEKSYVSFKLLPELIPEMPLPRPKFEIFVYSPRVEGVHLRGGKVARGGLRWSDRKEDFRTEVLGLVKAQQVKNTVIVPVGAKGGFICKQLPTEGGRQAFLEEGQECYRIFIRSLLDITDNIVDGKVIYPQDVVRLDEDDPYLVVAADKGTATFSDIANAISAEYNFWLGDAFASGGSVGYDHKKMGITARGAWESVKRHFREINIDCQTTPFSCVAVGDMAGDVFGNGMLLSKQTKLIVAFNHLHIFFDPTPDVAKSYKERQRLFENPQLSWDDYDKNLISKGGGVFSRSEKSITLTAEMKKLIGTSQTQMTPNELIHHCLKMPVDLIWNGGIGTYVKSSKESHAQVGDRANDDVRVNGKELQAKIIGEGGNLGCTQLGRMEYAANGGRINTDFIDNVGGVDCSDNEVNIKILLNALVNSGDITHKQRNELLYSMTDDVGDMVIEDCYRQSESMSISQLGGVSVLREQLRFIVGLEKEGRLNRELEFIPSDEELSERLASSKGLTRPEISVLISYGKMALKEHFNVAAITDNPYHSQLLTSAFPKVLQDKFSAQMEQHPLRSEIIATKLANNVINDMGMNYVFRIREETGASDPEIAQAYAIVKGVFRAETLWQNINKLDNKVPANVQLTMLNEVRRTLRRASRWYLRHGNKAQGIESEIQFYQPICDDLLANMSQYLDPTEFKELETNEEGFVKQGVPKNIAFNIACMSTLFSSFDLAQVASAEKRDKKVVASTYFKIGHELEIHWFLSQINRQTVSNYWQALARASYREELDWQQRSLTTVLLKFDRKSKDADKILSEWMKEHEQLLSRWSHMMYEFKTSSTHEFAKFSVALRELMLLSINCDVRQ